jgi:hypothetical protein
MCLDHITASQDAHIAGPFAMPESAANEQLLLPPTHPRAGRITALQATSSPSSSARFQLPSLPGSRQNGHEHGTGRP